MNPFTNEKTYPVMGYVNELENKVRKLRWQLQCHRFGSFASGIVVGIIIMLIAWRIIRF